MIPPFKIYLNHKEKLQFHKFVNEIFNSGQFTLGNYTNNFEKEFSQISNTKYNIAVNSGTTALEIIFRSLTRLNKQRDILAPTNTNYATIKAIIASGCNPVLYDGGLYPDIDNIKERMTKNTIAFVLVHIGGYISPEIKDIITLCKKKKILIIEDAAHAHGSQRDLYKAGSIGFASAYSFFPTKTMTTGEGGMIATNSTWLKKIATQYRDQGKNNKGTHVVMGNSWRMSEFEAALGLVQIANFNSTLKYRNYICDLYTSNLQTTPLRITGRENQILSGYKFIVKTKNNKERQALVSFLKKRDVFIGKGVYNKAIHQQYVFKNVFLGKFPQAEKFAKTHLCLPVWRNIKKTEIKTVCNYIKDFYNNKKL